MRGNERVAARLKMEMEMRDRREPLEECMRRLSGIGAGTGQTAVAGDATGAMETERERPAARVAK